MGVCDMVEALFREVAVCNEACFAFAVMMVKVEEDWSSASYSTRVVVERILNFAQMIR